MQVEKDTTSAPIKKGPKRNPYVNSWEQFTNKAMEILVENPTQARFVLKYLPKSHKFILKVTDDDLMVMKKCKGQDLSQIQKFAVLAGRAFTNETLKKVAEVEDKKQADNKKKNKKKKK